jgi:repressor LexA
MDASSQKQITAFQNGYLLKVKGDSMIEEGIYSDDWVLIERRCHADNGEIIVARVDKKEVSLKFIQQFQDETLLIPANSKMEAHSYHPIQVEIQGVVIAKVSICHCPLNKKPRESP